VVSDEGLRSYKAIAFISCSCNRVKSRTKTQLTTNATLRSAVLAKQKTFRGFSKSLGEELWIK